MIKNKTRISGLLFFSAIAILLATHFFYYPKWTKPGTEATISWDASGYYMYLPALFIYKDIKGCSFKDSILSRYEPTFDFQQAFIHESSGNYVMKYPIGQAVIFSPFFFTAHAIALWIDLYEADGFSRPYQFFISMGSLIYMLIGLFYLRKTLSLYFNSWSADLAMLGLVLGSNYLNYAAIDGAMTHNSLFTVYTLLIYQTIKYYQNPQYKSALSIGILVGLTAIIRPTEIMTLAIPLLWGVNLISASSLSERLSMIVNHLSKYASATAAMIVIGSIQLIYWKYATSDWIVYSYQDQGFSWLSPHIWKGLFSYKSGWLMYSPFMIFSLIGFYWLFKWQRQISFLLLFYTVMFIYVVFAWDIWWYGGSLGQRTMVQLYPVLAFPLAAYMEWFRKTAIWRQVILVFLMVILAYANLWFTHQAHLGGMLHPGHMTRAYYWKILGKYEAKREHLKLLDTRDSYDGKRYHIEKVYRDTSPTFVLNQDTQFSPTIRVPLSNKAEWLRVYGTFSISQKEWDMWRMTQWATKLYAEGKEVKSTFIRVHRLMDDNQQNAILFTDIKVGKKTADTLEIYFFNADSEKEIKIDSIWVESFFSKP